MYIGNGYIEINALIIMETLDTIAEKVRVCHQCGEKLNGKVYNGDWGGVYCSEKCRDYFTLD